MDATLHIMAHLFPICQRVTLCPADAVYDFILYSAHGQETGRPGATVFQRLLIRASLGIIVQHPKSNPDTLCCRSLGHRARSKCSRWLWTEEWFRTGGRFGSDGYHCLPQ
jgi:hypothetical protein